MQEPVIIPTLREGVELRQLATEADDAAYYDAVRASQEHLHEFGNETLLAYPDLDAVAQARLNPANPEKLRMGIWDGDTFVGSANLTPQGNVAEIGYWLDARHTGQGYATLAAKAITAYALRSYPTVTAETMDGNNASAKVLARAGFRKIAEEAGRLFFELVTTKKLTAPKAPERVADTVEFAEHPNRQKALRAKDKKNGTVFIAFSVAKRAYRCLCCAQEIAIGQGHAIVSQVQQTSRFTHHHVDLDCTHSKILPELRGIQTIDAEKASKTAMNARRRKHRYRQRKRAR
ncbi:MAG TPA: GNAT family N-acetyltransferase [Verrucomicrobiae bacterium]|nr:GNAT family N-acetyltransferase [Verrucomicrobiae bacterium]